ncbi:MAG: pyruvate dehydrogenase (acetyl-transferring) E1 component subunit alpha [Phycisphaeraceae bacterium]|nr:pyruvate dehydrogenase (acetyl-transferring) E1 component subunit alpha [Phycisphaeraceae bacterium]
MTITTAPPSGAPADDRASPTPSDALDAKALLGLLEQMLLIRRFEERCAQSYQQAKIGGFCHLYIGQEAVAVGSIAAVRPKDPIITAYRDHGHALARGMDPRYCMAEMFGKVTGCAKGKGGSMHMFDKPHHMYGGHAIVGGQAPLGVGLAFGIQYNKEDKVCLCYFGDGALNQGAVHEAMNLAAIWKLPILFVVENNLYSMGTHIARGTSMADNLAAKAGAYGMRYAECDGMGVLKVYDCFKTEADRTRAGEGPCFINVETYRFKGHSMSDPQKYRTKEEVEEFEEQDCVQRLRRRIIAKKMATEDQIQAIDDKCKKLAVAAVKFADESPAIGVDELYTDVYSQPFGPYKLGQPAEGFRE